MSKAEPRWSASIDRARYRARHTSLAVGLGLTLHVLYRSLMPDAQGRRDPEVAKEIIRRFRALLDADLQNVEAGLYPRDLLFQFPFALYARRTPEQVLDLFRVASRRRANRWRELPTDVDLSAYPHYYRRNFHWQTDGWLSRRSARHYDLEVELLFGGTADIMRRMALPPLVEAFRSASSPRVLDVGCGTGRFLLQLSRALPDAKLFGLDLSPFYLKEAAQTLEPARDVSLVAENAESMPFRDAEFDAATSVFLFHELPRAARRRVVAEMVRVVRPGGRVVICDSAQRIESAAIAPALEGFARTYHEPFYLDYIGDPLETLLAEAGVEVTSSRAYSVSKVVVGRVLGDGSLGDDDGSVVEDRGRACHGQAHA